MSEIVVHHGDSRVALKELPADSIDSVVTDPPYALVSITKRFGADNAAPCKAGKTGAYQRASSGFMGKRWDTGETAFDPDFWREVWRVMKPGAHLAAFGGTRSYHRLACAIEDAGFEIRDMVSWNFGSGFPKSHDVSKGIDKAAGAKRAVIAKGAPVKRMIPGADQNKVGWEKTNGREFQPAESVPATAEAAQWEGWGTALKPAFEPICLARKPLSEKTVAANVLRWGTGALNIDASRVGVREKPKTTDPKHSRHAHSAYGAPSGGGNILPAARWPANVCHDGSEEVLAAFPDSDGAQRGVGPEFGSKESVHCYGDFGPRATMEPRGDSGSAARFFKSAAYGEDELLFWQANATLAEWNPELANTADGHSNLSNEAVAFALSDVLTWALRVTPSLNPAASIAATPSELRRLLTTAIMAILSRDGAPSRAPPHDALTLTGCRVSVAEIKEPTDTTTITISHWKSDGSAAPVTFGITPSLRAHGEAAFRDGKRFHYNAKADAEDRLGSKHPTVKPVDLMRWLCKLVTPPGGLILDPFAGTGTTGLAAMGAGFDAILIEREAEYIADIERRIAWAKGEGRLTAQETTRKAAPANHGPLFAEPAE